MKQQTKEKNFAQINGSCKTAHLSDGLSPKPCHVCGTVHKLRECPFCPHRRAKKTGPGKSSGVIG